MQKDKRREKSPENKMKKSKELQFNHKKIYLKK